MSRRPPRSTRTDTLVPSPRLFRSPRYQDIHSGEVALLTSPDAGSLVRVIAGSVGGHAGPGSTYTPMTLAHATLEPGARRSEEHTSELQSLMRISYAVFCLKKKTKTHHYPNHT